MSPVRSVTYVSSRTGLSGPDTGSTPTTGAYPETKLINHIVLDAVAIELQLLWLVFARGQPFRSEGASAPLVVTPSLAF